MAWGSLGRSYNIKKGNHFQLLRLYLLSLNWAIYFRFIDHMVWIKGPPVVLKKIQLLIKKKKIYIYIYIYTQLLHHMNPPVVKKCKNAHLLFKKLGLGTNCNVISYSGISFGIRCRLT